IRGRSKNHGAYRREKCACAKKTYEPEPPCNSESGGANEKEQGKGQRVDVLGPWTLGQRHYDGGGGQRGDEQHRPAMQCRPASPVSRIASHRHEAIHDGGYDQEREPDRVVTMF